ncbi:uncharacterized protein LOC100901481 [Galendromus occidentalis]|uniref:Uncharacterized protein LOC100901481 n=1 Tax=Galendromus occidentalis TaxID=34638 RepID=A0AAJ6VWH6_9ACAR|nr:uncharacterized protein LOC100901481 [Galendromus occidentalis]
MSCQDMVPWPHVAPGEFDYYEERAGPGEIMVQAFDQNQQVGHGLQDRQGSHEFAQAYAAAVSLAARFQPSQLNIVDEIAVDGEMPDLPEVLDLHNPLPHRNTIPCSQDVDPGSLVLVSSQDPFAGLPVLHLDKNTILDFLQAPQSERPPGSRYLEAQTQSTSHSASQASLPFCLENYSYPSLPLVQSAAAACSSQQAGNQNYPINHKQMLAQKYAAEELQNSAFCHMVHAGMDTNDPTAALHQLFLGPQQQQQQMNKDDNPTDLLEGTIVGVDLSLSKSHANTSLCPQNRIPSQIVNRQDYPTVSRPPKKDRFQRSPPKEACGIFCDECGLFYDKECLMHRIMVIEDQMVQPRAFASLPSNHLSIQNLSSNASEPVFGVFSKKPIPNRTVFGPMEGVRVQVTHKSNMPFPIYISEDKDGCVLLDTKDDERSNWMRFVRYASSPVEQNLALFQQGSQIFFKSIVPIESKTELRVWYSEGYSQRYRLWLPQEFYVCFDCDLQFPHTDMLLHHIMSEHNDSPASQEALRKPKMHRYPSGSQWNEGSMSRQLSPQHLMNIAQAPSPGELSNVFCEPVENQVQRKGKRAINPRQPCNQELLPYNAEKSMDSVEIIEHITQAIGADCAGNLSTDMIPNNYLSLQNQHVTQLKEPEAFFNVRTEYPEEETREIEKRPEGSIMQEVPNAEEFDDTLYYTCKKRKTDATIRERLKVDNSNAPMLHNQEEPEAVAEEPRTVPSKISKFYQRHNEESSRSPDTSSQSDSSSSYRSDESSSSTSDSSRSSVLSEEPPPPKRLIKNIKNKHYVRADSNIVEIDSPLPESEESADICDELAAAAPTEAEKPPSPKATFMTPLKKKLPKLIPEEYQMSNQDKQPTTDSATHLEVQNAEITSAGCSESIESPAEKELEETRKDEKRTFPCLLCDAEFYCRIMLKEHSEQHSTPEGFKCTLCPRVLKDYMMIRRHIKLYHIYPTTKSFRCDVCGKTFCHTDKFQRHIRVHETGDKKFKCQQCGKILSRKDKLANHMKKVHFSDKSEAQQTEHRNGLDSSPKASPDSTQPTFPSGQEVTDENQKKNGVSRCRLKIEGTGIKKESFQCDKCPRAFRKRGMLAQHYAKGHPEVSLENTSLNDEFEKVITEFPCPYCDKSYKSSTKRKQHILKKHPDQEIPQSYKTMAASVRSTYVKCPWCPSQYTVRCKLYSHQRSKHHEILDILNLTGITEEAWEKKIPVSKKAECMGIQAKLEAELLARKDLQEAAKLSQQQSQQEKKSAKNPGTDHH